VVKVLLRFNINAKIKERKNAYIVYVKDNEAVSDLLALMGATQAVIELNDRFMERQFAQQINRRTNCDIANINKTVAASMRIVESINYISSKIGIAALDDKLQVVARARLENPDDSFAVLADALGLSKSTLKNRFKKLDDIASELKAKEKKD
jgi:DNA-binding protein WhiA